jgi:hypothetical protein
MLRFETLDEAQAWLSENAFGECTILQGEGVYRWLDVPGFGWHLNRMYIYVLNGVIHDFPASKAAAGNG